jgi:pilus assembly protein CpaF
MTNDLLDAVLEHDDLADLDVARRRLAIRRIVTGLGSPLESAAEIADAIDGYGPLSELMSDESVTDVLVNGPDEVWVEREGRLDRTRVSFADAEHLHAFVERIVARCSARVDISSPLVDARLPDGSRLHVALPPVAPQGPLISIRRFPAHRFELEELVRPEEAARLRACVVARRTVAISGSTGSGKTTLLNALLGCVPPDERLVTIEETPELAPRCAHAVALIARPPNLEGRGAVTLRDLVRTALRMRPDRLVVGEVRGAEALDAISAVSTGHEGSMITLHARGPSEVVERLVSCALLAASGEPAAALQRRVHSALDVVVHLERNETGARRIAAIEEL